MCYSSSEWYLCRIYFLNCKFLVVSKSRLLVLCRQGSKTFIFTYLCSEREYVEKRHSLDFFRTQNFRGLVMTLLSSEITWMYNQARANERIVRAKITKNSVDMIHIWITSSRSESWNLLTSLPSKNCSCFAVCQLSMFQNISRPQLRRIVLQCLHFSPIGRLSQSIVIPPPGASSMPNMMPNIVLSRNRMSSSGDV